MKRYSHLLSSILKWIYRPAILVLPLSGCSKKTTTPAVIDPSPAGLLSRYDLLASDYDALPVTTFVLSFNNSNQLTDVYEKAGQKLVFYTCDYAGNALGQTMDNNLGTQSYAYNGQRITELDYATPIDTGKRVFTYDSTGRLASVFDSVTNPPSFPVMYLYQYVWDSSGNNVIEVITSQLDLSKRPTLYQESFYTFDTRANAFSGFPPLPDARQLPGDLPALFNKNNVTSMHRVGTIPATGTGSSVPTLDTIAIYNSVRQYKYNTKDYPTSCQESFQDLQYNYSGKRTFSYDY